MSSPHSNQPYHPPEGQPAPGKPTWLIYVIGAIIVLFLLNKVGCGPVQTHEKMEWLDK